MCNKRYNTNMTTAAHDTDIYIIAYKKFIERNS